MLAKIEMIAWISKRWTEKNTASFASPLFSAMTILLFWPAPLHKERPGYETKQSDGEVTAMLEV